MIAWTSWNAINFTGELLGSGVGFAGKAKEPLQDYIGRFNELDAKLRTIDALDPGCTNYVQWMESAIECKRKLRQWKQIDPWLEKLSATASNNWKMLHAVALGYREVNGRWESVQCMDQAFRLAQSEKADDKAIGQLGLDYIDLLLYERLEAPYKLQVKTPGITATQYQADLDGLW